MKPFKLISPGSLEAAREAAAQSGVELRAGGVDLIDHHKEGLSAPSALVNLRRLPAEALGSLRGSESVDGRLELGAMLNLNELAAHPTLRGPFAALSEAAGQAATPSIRNLATMGGNLLQRPRCWYYRDTTLRCLKKGGSACLAISGDHRYHAILGGGPSFAVHASSLATPLLALNASVRVHGQGGAREFGISELFVHPSEDPTREHRLAPGEVLTQVLLPTPAKGARSAYHAAREKQSHDWPLAEAAVSLRLQGGRMSEVRIALGHVAPTPWRASEAEALLEGQAPSEALFAKAAAAALSKARPLPGSAYKVPVTQGVVRYALHAATGLALPE